VCYQHDGASPVNILYGKQCPSLNISSSATTIQISFSQVCNLNLQDDVFAWVDEYVQQYDQSLPRD